MLYCLLNYIYQQWVHGLPDVLQRIFFHKLPLFYLWANYPVLLTNCASDGFSMVDILLLLLLFLQEFDLALQIFFFQKLLVLCLCVYIAYTSLSV